jgi:transcriptional regulator with XRE-family HTH domain
MSDLLDDAYTPSEQNVLDDMRAGISIARSLMSARIDKGWTQEHLAQVAKVWQSRVSSIESVRGNPRLGTLNKLANALGMTVRIVQQWDRKPGAARPELSEEDIADARAADEAIAEGSFEDWEDVKRELGLGEAVDHVAPAAAGEPKGWCSICGEAHEDKMFWGEGRRWCVHEDCLNKAFDEHPNRGAASAEREGLAAELEADAVSLSFAVEPSHTSLTYYVDALKRAAAALRARPGEKKP